MLTIDACGQARPTCEKIVSYVRQILLFLIHSYVKSHINNDIWIPPNLQDDSGDMQYSVSNTAHKEFHFPHFVMVIMVLWAELWFVVISRNVILIM